MEVSYGRKGRQGSMRTVGQERRTRRGNWIGRAPDTNTAKRRAGLSAEK